uniref:Ig-like domain-containing protein n=1 Tax=Pygocentrus nattereri TaxID=42514 RepID=A0AAR2J867_PYGNA
MQHLWKSLILIALTVAVTLALPQTKQELTKPPTIIEKPESQDVIPGTRVKFNVLVSGTPPLTIKWFKDKKEVLSGLFFTKPSDSGQYTCKITNDVGSDSCQAMLFVKGLFLDYSLISSYKVSVVKSGQSVVFECQVVGTPEIDTYWFRDGNEISPGAKHKITFGNSLARLEITDADVKDSGVYYCEARNEAGSESCSMELKVKGHSLKLTHPIIQQTEGHSVQFECRVAGSSPMEISWLKDGEPLRSDSEYTMTFDDNSAVLKIAKGEMRHSGEYTCVATNSVGTASCRAKLTLQGLFSCACGSFSWRYRRTGMPRDWIITNKSDLVKGSQRYPYRGQL